MSAVKVPILILTMFQIVFATGCSIPFVSEQEIAIEADTQFASMRAQNPISTDGNIRRYVYCVALASERS